MNPSPLQKSLKWFAVSVLSVLASFSAYADGAFNLGGAGQYTVFSLSKGVTVNGGLISQPDIVGDIGALGGTVSLNNNVLVSGNVYYSGSFVHHNQSSITGSAFNGALTVAALQQAAADAQSASQTAFTLTATAGFASNYTVKTDLTLNGTGNVVLNLKTFVVKNNATLTLAGDSSTTFVINVTKQFLLNNGHIELSGGLTASNVLFNIGGQIETASILAGSSLEGILLAPNAVIKVTGNSQITGKVIGKKIVLSGKNPPVVSP